MLMTHNNTTTDNNPIRAGRQFSLHGIVIVYRLCVVLRSQRNRRDGSDNGNSGQEGEDDDKPISANHPTKCSGGYSAVFSREDGE